MEEKQLTDEILDRVKVVASLRKEIYNKNRAVLNGSTTGSWGMNGRRTHGLRNRNNMYSFRGRTIKRRGSVN